MAFDRATTLAWTQAQVQIHYLGIGADEAHLFQRLANRVLYSDPTLRPPSEALKRGDGVGFDAMATREFPGICRSSWSVSTKLPISMSCGSFCWRTNIGG